MWSICILAIVLQGCSFQNLEGPIVETPQGRALGWERISRDGRVYQAWTRIPYAQPPVGELRFMSPKMAEKWTGTLNATADLPACLQAMSGGTTTGSEDCLYLNVYRPKAGFDQALPVIFYIYGGSYQNRTIGSREVADYIMDEDVILVAHHYRVNFFGFLTLGDKIFPGNFGLKDMVMALRWVKRNIASFGGDPNSVTVHGISSGAECAHQLLHSPLVEEEGGDESRTAVSACHHFGFLTTEELLARGFSDSGTINHVHGLMKVDEVRENTLNIVRAVGCDRNCSEEIRNCLQAADGAAIIKAYNDHYPRDMSKLPFAAVIEPKDAEDNVIPEDLSLRKSSKPWVASTSNGEHCVFKLFEIPSWIEIVHNNLTGYLESWIAEHTSDSTVIREGARLLEKFYLQNTERMENFTLGMEKMDGDNGFVYPYLFNIEEQMNNGPTWASRLEYKGELSGKTPSGSFTCSADVAVHGEVLHLYFNLRSSIPGTSPIETPADKAVSKRLIKYLVNFAYYSNPTPPGSPFIWKQYKGNEFMRITKNGDFMADANYVKNLKFPLLDIWSYVIGWK